MILFENFKFSYTNPFQYGYYFWLMVDAEKWNQVKNGEWKHVLHRGNNPKSNNVSDIKLQNPGIYLEPVNNNMVFVIDTQNGSDIDGEERIVYEDFPMNKWFNVCVVLDHYSVSVYIDGKLLISRTLPAQVKDTTKNNLYVNIDGGFGGNMAYLKVFNQPIGPQVVNDQYNHYKSKVDKYIDYSVDKYIDGLENTKLIV